MYPCWTKGKHILDWIYQLWPVNTLMLPRKSGLSRVIFHSLAWSQVLINTFHQIFLELLAFVVYIPFEHYPYRFVCFCELYCALAALLWSSKLTSNVLVWLLLVVHSCSFLIRNNTRCHVLLACTRSLPGKYPKYAKLWDSYNMWALRAVSELKHHKRISES